MAEIRLLLDGEPSKEMIEYLQKQYPVNENEPDPFADDD